MSNQHSSGFGSLKVADLTKAIEAAAKAVTSKDPAHQGAELVMTNRIIIGRQVRPTAGQSAANFEHMAEQIKAQVAKQLPHAQLDTAVISGPGIWTIGFILREELISER